MHFLGGAYEREPDVMIDINTTPLIDVMLVLIIMLIITIPIHTHAVKLNMPTGNPPPSPPEVITIEEIENGLHPSRVHLLIELIEQVTRDRSRQVIATTHSPLSLLALRAARNDAIVFGRRPGEQGSVMRRLGELPDFERVAKKVTASLQVRELDASCARGRGPRTACVPARAV